jgi:hypothetical protein
LVYWSGGPVGIEAVLNGGAVRTQPAQFIGRKRPPLGIGVRGEGVPTLEAQVRATATLDDAPLAAAGTGNALFDAHERYAVTELVIK